MTPTTDLWLDTHMTTTTATKTRADFIGWNVICEDGEIRHAAGFATLAEAREFAEWGHCCTNQHEIRETILGRVGFSEVACFMGVAGELMLMEKVGLHAVQLRGEDGRLFSAPITTGEAGPAALKHFNGFG